MRWVLAGLSLMIAAAAVAPAQAQLIHSNPRVNDGQIRIDPLLCQTDYQIRQSLAAAGYSHVALNAPVDNHVLAHGTRGKIVYLIDYEFCLGGGILSVRPLRAAN